MEYNAKVKEVYLCGCGNEGNMLVQIGNKLLKVYYQAPDAFIEEYLIKKANMIPQTSLEFGLPDKSNVSFSIDLWLVYGECKRMNDKIKKYPSSLKVCGGIISGEVISVYNENEFRIDCGIFLDVDNESDVHNWLTIGDYVEVTGTYQVYFPETDFCK